MPCPCVQLLLSSADASKWLSGLSIKLITVKTPLLPYSTLNVAVCGFGIIARVVLSALQLATL